MAYKKAPSIKHIDKKKREAVAKLVRENKIQEFMMSMSTKQREGFEQALDEKVNAHKNQDNGTR